MELTCTVCNMKFTEDIRLQRHLKTHENKSKKNKVTKLGKPDFEKPDFTQVM